MSGGWSFYFVVLSVLFQPYCCKRAFFYVSLEAKVKVWLIPPTKEISA